MLAADKSSVFLSYAETAVAAEEFLKLTRTWRTASASMGPPVITKKQHAVLLKRRDAAVIVDFLAPLLEELCVTKSDDDGDDDDDEDPCPIVLVNSEKHQWLHAHAGLSGSSRDVSPSLWLTWKPFVLFKSPVDAALPVGVPGGAALQVLGCVAAVFDAKDRGVELDRPEVGKLLACLSCVDQEPCRGMLFNGDDFVLCTQLNGAVAERTDGKLTEKGSVAAIRDFFARIEPPPLVTTLRRVLRALDTTTVHVDGRCYLGSGAHGTIGSPTRTQGRPPAARRSLPLLSR